MDKVALFSEFMIAYNTASAYLQACKDGWSMCHVHDFYVHQMKVLNTQAEG